MAAYLLLDLSIGAFIPLNNCVAPNNLDDALNYYFRLRWVAPNFEAVVVIAGFCLVIIRWESSFSFLKIVFFCVSVSSNWRGRYRHKLSQIDDFSDEGNLGTLSRSNKAFNK